MATDLQIESNRRNAQMSTGPRSIQGKSSSRRNAHKHGMAGTSTDVAAFLQAEFDVRRNKWAAEIDPETDQAEYALDRAIAASIRIERCEDAIEALTVEQTTCARLIWDDDRRVEAATLLSQLSKDPVLVSAQLASTRHGADLMKATWDRLGEALVANRDWSEFERSTALDLLGVSAGLRDGRTPLDPPDGHDRADWLQSVAVEERNRLERRKAESLDAVDAIRRRQAEAAALVVLSKPAALILRYERDAWRRYRESMKAAKAPASEESREVEREARPGAPGFASALPAPSRSTGEVIATRPVNPLTPAMLAQVEELSSGRSNPESAEEVATLLAAFDARRVALGRPTFHDETLDRPITPAPVAKRHLNRHQRRALRSMDRSA